MHFCPCISSCISLDKMSVVVRPWKVPPTSSIQGIICHRLLVVQETDCRDRRSLSQYCLKLGTMPPDLPVNVAERPDNSQLDSEPQPSNLNTKECSLKHLPNEVLIVIAQNCQDKDLGTLCQVSKLMQSIAGRELYRTVVISTNARRIRFCRTITEEPASGRYFVEELKFLPPADVFKCPNYFMETLKRLSNLRRLTIALVGRTLSPTLPSSSIWELQLGIFHQTWDIFTRSQGYIFAPAILPRLEQVRLIPDIRSQNPNERLAHPRVLNPFLRLPSLSHLEFLNDSGIWIRDACLMRQGMQPTSKQQSIQDPRQIIQCCPLFLFRSQSFQSFPSYEYYNVRVCNCLY